MLQNGIEKDICTEAANKKSGDRLPMISLHGMYNRKRRRKNKKNTDRNQKKSEGNK